MTLLVLLLVLLLLFGGGGMTYHSWGGTGPAWGGNVLYAIAVVVLVLILLRFLTGGLV